MLIKYSWYCLHKEISLNGYVIKRHFKFRWWSIVNLLERIVKKGENIPETKTLYVVENKSDGFLNLKVDYLKNIPNTLSNNNVDILS